MDADIDCWVGSAAIFRAASLFVVTAPFVVSAIWFMMAIITAMARKDAARDREQGEHADEEKKWFHIHYSFLNSREDNSSVVTNSH